MGYLDQTQQAYYSGGIHGSYQNLSLNDIIDNFTAAYVGEGKVLANVLKADVNFHAHRALAELSYDTLKSCKSQEITLPPSLQMILPQDYVNYVKLTWSDANGIEHVIYPASKTSNPNSIAQDDDGNYIFTAGGWLNPSTSVSQQPQSSLYQFPIELTILELDPTTNQFVLENMAEATPFEVDMEIVSDYFPIGTTITAISSSSTTGNTLATGPNLPVNPNGDIYEHLITLSNDSTNIAAVVNSTITISKDSDTWSSYKSSSNNQVAVDQSTTTNLAVDADNYFQNTGERYGLDGQYAQANGSFFIDCNSGKIHFSSNLSGKTIILHYLSDNLGTDDEMLVPKLAEEAIYKWIAYGCLSARADTPEYVLQRFKREKFSETRKAKIRLSNIKIEEITQIIRGKSKWIKH